MATAGRSVRRPAVSHARKKALPLPCPIRPHMIAPLRPSSIASGSASSWRSGMARPLRSGGRLRVTINGGRARPPFSQITLPRDDAGWRNLLALAAPGSRDNQDGASRKGRRPGRAVRRHPTRTSPSDPDFDAHALVLGLDGSKRARLTRFLLEVCGPLFRASSDPLFVANARAVAGGNGAGLRYPVRALHADGGASVLRRRGAGHARRAAQRRAADGRRDRQNAGAAGAAASPERPSGPCRSRAGGAQHQPAGAEPRSSSSARTAWCAAASSWLRAGGCRAPPSGSPRTQSNDRSIAVSSWKHWLAGNAAPRLPRCCANCACSPPTASDTAEHAGGLPFVRRPIRSLTAAMACSSAAS